MYTVIRQSRVEAENPSWEAGNYAVLEQATTKIVVSYPKHRSWNPDWLIAQIEQVPGLRATRPRGSSPAAWHGSLPTKIDSQRVRHIPREWANQAGDDVLPPAVAATSTPRCPDGYGTDYPHAP